MLALRAANQLSGAEIARSIDFLTAKGDDFTLLSTSNASKPYVSAYVLLALQSYGAQFQIAANIDQARLRLAGQLQNGSYSETVLDTVGAIAFAYASTNDPNLAGLRTKIRSAQLANGSWGNDAFLTALALPALSVASEPPAPTTGELSLLVRDVQTLAPLADATLVLAPNSQFTGTSNAVGSISIALITPNTYSATLSRSGYQSKTLSNIQIQAGQQLDIGTVSLTRLSTAAVLRGQVTDVRDGSPIAGTNVTMTGLVDTTLSSGPDGRYQHSVDAGGAISPCLQRRWHALFF